MDDVITYLFITFASMALYIISVLKITVGGNLLNWVSKMKDHDSLVSYTNLSLGHKSLMNLLTMYLLSNLARTSIGYRLNYRVLFSAFWRPVLD